MAHLGGRIQGAVSNLGRPVVGAQRPRAASAAQLPPELDHNRLLAIANRQPRANCGSSLTVVCLERGDKNIRSVLDLNRPSTFYDRCADLRSLTLPPKTRLEDMLSRPSAYTRIAMETLLLHNTRGNDLEDTDGMLSAHLGRCWSTR